MDNIRVIMCDTNQADLEGYAKICRSLCAEKDVPVVLTTFSNSDSLLFEMSDRAFPSLVSVLVVAPEGGCDKVAATCRNHGYDGIILYLCRHAEEKYFYDAFEVKAINLVKKGDLTRFAKAFGDALVAADQLERQYILLNCAGEYRQIDIRDIYYFETTMDHMVCVWYAGGKFVFQSSLANLEERMRDRGFIRTHRSYLVSMDTIHRIAYEEVTLNNGKSIPVSRNNYQPLKDAMDRWRQ